VICCCIRSHTTKGGEIVGVGRATSAYVVAFRDGGLDGLRRWTPIARERMAAYRALIRESSRNNRSTP